jgi:hypothetical protein
MYDTIPELIEQFQAFITKARYSLSNESVMDFFEHCIYHSAWHVSSEDNPHLIAKILIRMTGLLPINAKNFNLKAEVTTRFAQVILDDIMEYFNDLFNLVNESEWILFRDGLTYYLIFALHSQQKSTINMIRQIQNQTYQRDLARSLLNRLEGLQSVTLDDTTIELFSLVDSIDLSLKQLTLTRTIPTYIMGLTRMMSQHIHTRITNTDIEVHFNNLIVHNYLPGRIADDISK